MGGGAASAASSSKTSATSYQYSAAAQMPLVNQSNSELQKELEDTKDKLKIMTTKFGAARKERDQLKTENKELQDEVIQLQSSNSAHQGERI